MKIPLPLFFILNIVNYSFGIIIEDYCQNYPRKIQCQALSSFQETTSRCNIKIKVCRYADSKPTSFCDPTSSTGCLMNDIVDPNIASCKQVVKSGYGMMPGRRKNIYHSCVPSAASPVNIFLTRISMESGGEMQCVPELHGKKLICGERGTKCVCEPSAVDQVRSGITGVQKGFFLDRMSRNVCRCQWFIDFCQVEEICSKETTGCVSTEAKVKCTDGSINQCIANPSLCRTDNALCVELEDRNAEWQMGAEKIGDGYACINTDIFKSIREVAPYCDFGKTDITVSGMGVKRPEQGVDRCCYQYLVCAVDAKGLGGYMFRKRPCYCTTEFKRCLMKQKETVKFKEIAEGLIKITEQIKICSMDDSGKCDPLKPESCKKGDLIEPTIAHCKINCKTGPLLPIQFRSCRVRQCIPMYNSNTRRIIDITSHHESSRCDGVKGLPIECGMHQTRCVCDGQPTVDYFTDRCRCQFWPF